MSSSSRGNNPNTNRNSITSASSFSRGTSNSFTGSSTGKKRGLLSNVFGLATGGGGGNEGEGGGRHGPIALLGGEEDGEGGERDHSEEMEMDAEELDDTRLSLDARGSTSKNRLSFDPTSSSSTKTQHPSFGPESESSLGSTSKATLAERRINQSNSHNTNNNDKPNLLSLGGGNAYGYGTPRSNTHTNSQQPQLLNPYHLNPDSNPNPTSSTPLLSGSRSPSPLPSPPALSSPLHLSSSPFFTPEVQHFSGYRRPSSSSKKPPIPSLPLPPFSALGFGNNNRPRRRLSTPAGAASGGGPIPAAGVGVYGQTPPGGVRGFVGGRRHSGVQSMYGRSGHTPTGGGGKMGLGKRVMSGSELASPSPNRVRNGGKAMARKGSKGGGSEFHPLSPTTKVGFIEDDDDHSTGDENEEEDIFVEGGNVSDLPDSPYPNPHHPNRHRLSKIPSTLTSASGGNSSIIIHTPRDHSHYHSSGNHSGGAGEGEEGDGVNVSNPTDSPPPITPLPLVPMLVLCICMIGEFLTAGVAGPFMFFMVEDFFKASLPADSPALIGLESRVGFWSGIVASSFFFSQFLTSLLWSSFAQTHGRRSVIFLSLLGNTLCVILFGTSKSLSQAICIRLGQGLFNGAVGVARGVVSDITDGTNEQKAYALVGFCWGMGGIVGPIVGGVLQNPVERFPGLFDNASGPEEREKYLFGRYPYLLPCLVAGGITAVGCVLSLFLGWDGGSRNGGWAGKGGAIVLDGEEKDLEVAVPIDENERQEEGDDMVIDEDDDEHQDLPPSTKSSPSFRQRISGYFGLRNNDNKGEGPSPLRRTPRRSSTSGSSVRTVVPSTTTPAGTPNPTRRGSQAIATPASGDGGRRPSNWTTRTGFTRASGAGMGLGIDRRRVSTATGLSVGGGGSRSVSSGYAYPGYGDGRVGGRRLSQRSRRMTGRSNYWGRDGGEGDRRGSIDSSALPFAQRLLLANEGAVFSITDLWVAAATQNDPDRYSIADIDNNVFEDDDEDDFVDLEAHAGEGYAEEFGDGYYSDMDDVAMGSRFGYGSTAPSSMNVNEENARGRGHKTTGTDITSSTSSGSATIMPDGPSSPEARPPRRSFGKPSSVSTPQRHLSMTSIAGSGRDRDHAASPSRPPGRKPSFAASARSVPPIYANTGLASTPLSSPGPYSAELPGGSGSGHQRDETTSPTPSPGQLGPQGLGSIPEQKVLDSTSPQRQRRPTTGAAGGLDGTAAGEMEAGTSGVAMIQPEKTDQPESVWKLLPITLIVQYAVLALHGSVCDQVFMSFLVTPVASGGLGLSSAHYAELISMMCFFQLIFQFRFYPNVGPPRGSLSHLTMFRLGLVIYIPVYLLFPELRGLLHESTNGFVMFGMVVLFSLRTLSNICAYTAVMILFNAMTPPPLLGLSNGLAQSAVSAARFCGPVLGGTIWAYSISDGPTARSYPWNYALGFFVIACVCAAGLAHSFFIR